MSAESDDAAAELFKAISEGDAQKVQECLSNNRVDLSRPQVSGIERQ